MKTAYSYLRVSGKSQIDGDGFPRQREAIANYARQNGINVLREFVEEGISGAKNAFDREALPELLESLRLNGVTLVLIERADRLARDSMVSEILLLEFCKLGVQVVAADSGTDLTVADGDPTKKLIRQILGNFAEYEKSILVAKLRAARVRQKKATGRCEGRKPYGRDDAERRTIEHMNLMRAQALSFKNIASQLNSQGIKPRSGAKWHPTAVRRIMSANCPQRGLKLFLKNI